MKTLFLIIIFIIIALSSCKNNKTNILKKDSIFVYNVILESKGGTPESIGYLQLMYNHNYWRPTFGNQINIKWKYFLNSVTLEDNTLASDDDTGFEIHPPRESIFSFTELPPFPRVRLPIEINTKFEIDLTVLKYKDSVFSQLENKVVKQRVQLTREIDTLINGKMNKCYYSFGSNINFIKELGVYKIETYFTKSKGFVLIKYIKPNGDKITLVQK